MEDLGKAVRAVASLSCRIARSAVVESQNHLACELAQLPSENAQSVAR